jgi:hypothetical protein
MWSKLDDALIDHRKIYAAGRVIGKNGPVIALGFYTLGLLWSNKHLTDGFLPEDVVLRFGHADNPRSIADALVKAELLEKVSGGFQIHDFDEYNPLAKHIKARRKGERLRKQQERASRNGHS